MNVTELEVVVPPFGIPAPLPSTPELIVVCDGGSKAAIFQLKLAGVGSLLPAVSTALTWKVCDPIARSVRVVGLEHAEKPPLSGARSC